MDDGAADQLGQSIDGLGVARAEVEHLTGERRLRRQQEAARHVGDVDEVPALGAIADDRQRLAVRLLRQEHAEDGPVHPGGPDPRPVDVEHADGDDREPVDPRPVQCRQLAQVLAERVGVLRPDGRVLRRRHLGKTEAGGRGGIDELLYPAPAASLQDGQGPVDVGPHIVDRSLDGRDDVPDPAEVEDQVDPVEHGRRRAEVAHVDLLDGEPRVRPVLAEVLEPSGGEVVDRTDLEALREQEIDHVAADEPGAARDDRTPHASFAAWTALTL